MEEIENRSPFNPQDANLIKRMAADLKLRALVRRAFDSTTPYRYSYNWKWLGRPIIQFPQDVMALQEIIWRTKPEVIVETGVAHGGSVIFSASMLALLGGTREVIGVDIDIRTHNKLAIEQHPLSEHVTLIQGSSIDPDIAAQVKARVNGRTAIVVLDSNHTADHVFSELVLYSPLVSAGFYCIVLDTVIEYMEPSTIIDRPWRAGNSPLTAVERFLASQPRFFVDEEYDKLLFTSAPKGYLCARADN